MVRLLLALLPTLLILVGSGIALRALHVMAHHRPTPPHVSEVESSPYVWVRRG